MPLKAVAVFCGSSRGKDPQFQEAAKGKARLKSQTSDELIRRTIRPQAAQSWGAIYKTLYETLTRFRTRIFNLIP